MPQNKKYGVCHICGNDGELSFEHVPPRRAFNDRQVIKISFKKALELGPETTTKGEIQQRGSGEYTLCPRCNNNTGSWYGNQFVSWCYQGMEVLEKSGGNPSAISIINLRPLPILKSIAAMFFSVNSSNFSKKAPELVRFVLDKNKKYLSKQYRFFVYYNITGKNRYAGVVGRINVFSGENVYWSEISFPPFGYVMTLNSNPPDSRLFEITHFSRYDFDMTVDMQLKMPVLPTDSPFPGDYRTKEKLRSILKKKD